MKWEIGLSTGIAYRAPIGDVLPYISDCGFRAVEVSTAPGHVPFDDPRGLAAVQRSLSGHRLRVHSLTASSTGRASSPRSNGWATTGCSCWR